MMHMMKSRFWAVHFFSLLCVSWVLNAGLLVSSVHAQENTPRQEGRDWLPTGRYAVRLESRLGFVNQKLNSDGSVKPVYGEYDGVSLNSKVIPLLSVYGSTATLGTTHLGMNASGERYRLSLAYGVSEDLNIGFTLPWGDLRTQVDFSVTGANLAANPTFNPTKPIGLTNPPFVPKAGAFAGLPAAGTEDFQRVLTQSVYGFQYNRVASYGRTEILDPLIGARLKLSDTPEATTVFAPTLRIGLAPHADPNNLLDIPVAEGNNALKLGVEHARNLGGDWELRLFGQYTIQSPDEVTARARSAAEGMVPLSRTETLNRRLGNVLDASVEIGQRVDNWRLAARLEEAVKDQDHFVSARHQDVSGLEAHTDTNSSILVLLANWNGIPAYREGRIPLPLLLSFQISRVLEGRNVYLTQYAYLTVTVPF
jgi:hypothetical protein